MASNPQGTPRYYVPHSSWFPLAASIGLWLLLYGAAGWMNHASDMNTGIFGIHGKTVFIIGLVVFAFVLFSWFGAAIRENVQGLNSKMLGRSYRISMQWFIFSEVMFFAAFFGALFYLRHYAGPWLSGEGSNVMTGEILWPGYDFSWGATALTPQEQVGLANQPIANNGTFTAAKEAISAWHLPLYNTILLVTSSITCHFAHHALKHGQKGKFHLLLGITLLLGYTFVAVQAYEYYEAYEHLGLTLNSGSYGTTFFMLTGFHGFHVCLGAVILTVMFLRSFFKGHFTPDDHFGFEGASWYWHFVDVVWIGLFIFVYVI